MKIIVILSRFPFPLEKGDKLRAYHQLLELKKENDVILCCLSNRNPSLNELKEVEKICSSLHVFKLNRIRQFLRLGYALFSSKPFQVHYFFQKSISKKIKRIVETEKPDHIYAQLVRTTEYVKNFHDMPKTLDFMDALNKNYSRRVEHSKGVKKILVKEESQRLVSYENLIFDYFEKHTIISEQDKKLIYHEKRDQIEVIPNGVDYEYFQPLEPLEERKVDLLFTGNMGYLPNEDAALFLIKEIMPLLWQIDDSITLTIAGASPSSKLASLHSNKVNITGWVNDIRDEFNRSKIFVAPMRQGTGLQNKLLEAMSMGLPCVTTHLANNALNALPNEDLFVYEDNEHLVSLIMHLINDKNARENMGKKARKFILEKYSWEEANKRLERLITQITNH